MAIDRLKTLLQGKKVRLGALSGGGVLTLAAVLALVNLLSQTLSVRWDWTTDNRYSLSPATKRLLRSLEDPVLIKVYLSQGLPQPYETHGRYLKDILKEYRAAGKGRVRVEYLNPDESDKLKSEAAGAGLSPARFTQVASDQFQIREGYMGLVLYYQDKQEAIPFVQNPESLEYDLSSRIKHMASKTKPVLGFVTGHGEASPLEFQEGPLAQLKERFQVETVELSTTSAVKPDVLFILGPRRALAPAELAVLDDHLLRGAPLAVFLNRRLVNLGSFSSIAQVTGLEPFLEHYGLAVERDFVLDAQCQRISLQSQQGGFSISNILNYPALPLSNRINKKHPLTQSLDVLGFPFAHALTPRVSENNGLKVTPLAQSSRHSWTFPNLSSLDPYSIPPPTEDNPKGPFLLAALVEGSTTAYSRPDKKIESLKLAVVGTSFFYDSGMPNPEGNAAFLSGLAEWFSQDPLLLSIPSKGSPFRPLRQLPPWARPLVKLLGFFLLPALVIAGGFFRWRRRQSHRLQVEQVYRPSAIPKNV